MPLDAEMEAVGFNSKSRAKNFNHIWHPYLPRKVSAMQWLILTEGLPVRAWRERIGMPNHCQFCPSHPRETLQHAFKECSEIGRTYELFRVVRQLAGLPASYLTWNDINRGLMSEPDGPSMEEELRWDTAAAVTVNMNTPWDVLRAQLLWSIWCRRVELAFRDDQFHLGAVLWHAWRNTIYCAMKAYRELSRHARNEEKRQELISCFQHVWRQAHIFSRLSNGDIKWNITPPAAFLPADLGAWNATPICIHHLSPSPDLEAEFIARSDFNRLVDDFLQEAANDWQPADNVRSPNHTQEPDSPAHGRTPPSSPRGGEATVENLKANSRRLQPPNRVRCRKQTPPIPLPGPHLNRVSKRHKKRILPTPPSIPSDDMCCVNGRNRETTRSIPRPRCDEQLVPHMLSRNLDRRTSLLDTANPKRRADPSGGVPVNLITPLGLKSPSLGFINECPAL